VTTFFGVIARDGGMKLSSLGYENFLDLFLDGEQGIGIQLNVIIHLANPWFEDST
jgi:hypothetical protein